MEVIIEDVNEVFKKTLKERYLKRLIIFAICYGFWAYFIITYIPRRFHTADTAGNIAIWALTIPIGIVVVLLFGLWNSILRKFYQQFAATNGYTYEEQVFTMTGEGALFFIGRDHNYTNVMRGTFQNHPVGIFNFDYTVGEGKHSHKYQYTVLEIDYDSQIPKMFLRVDKHRFNMVKPKFDQGRRLKLEGNFDDYFDLFVEEKFEIEALQVFTPDIMHKLMTSWHKLNLEFVNDKIYIYANGVVVKRAELQSMYDLARYLVQKLAPVLARMESSVKAMQERI